MQADPRIAYRFNARAAMSEDHRIVRAAATPVHDVSGARTHELRVVGQWAGALFLVGFAALFFWQVGGFIKRNRPLVYTFDSLPKALLP